MEEVGRFETNLVNRFSQSEQLAYNRGHSHGASHQSVLQHELGQARRTHSAQISTLRNEVSQAQSQAVSAAERDRVHQELQEFRTRDTDSKENWRNSNTTCKLPVLRRLNEMSYLRSSCKRAKPKQLMSLKVVGILRTELPSAQLNLSQMGADRLRMNRNTQRLEQLEASAVEVDVLVSRERDSLHNELMRTLESTAAQGRVVPPPPPPIQPPAVPQTQYPLW
eukprot:1794216-Amphidinium_carterae.1